MLRFARPLFPCVFGGVKKEFFGFDPRTTTNRMELMAPIQGLLALQEPCEVEITTDSEYVLYGMTKWILHKTTRVWTRGHAGHEDNTRCDWLAQNASATQRNSWADGRPHAPLRLGLGVDYVPPKPHRVLN